MESLTDEGARQALRDAFKTLNEARVKAGWTEAIRLQGRDNLIHLWEGKPIESLIDQETREALRYARKNIRQEWETFGQNEIFQQEMDDIQRNLGMVEG